DVCSSVLPKANPPFESAYQVFDALFLCERAFLLNRRRPEMSGRAENPNGETRRRFFWNAAGRSVDVPGRRDRGSNIFLRFVKEWTPNTYTRNSIMEAQHAQKAQGGWSVNQQQAPTLAIILLSKDLERLHAGSLVGSVAAMSGMSVRLFVTMNALE